MKTRMATDADKDIPAYDHTKLSAINTCPTWGIVRYTKHLVMPGANRAMALEAGGASHEGFAAVRWYQYHSTQVTDKTTAAIAQRHAIRLFGEDRLAPMMDTLSAGATDRTNVINFAMESLYSCGFYDDIDDKRRTISSISEALISYVDRYDMHKWPVWVRDVTDPNSDLGIEIAFDIVIEFEYTYTSTDDGLLYEGSRNYRFTGKLDGLHIQPLKNNDLLVIEEKTGARLDDAWLAQWILSHQITGYCVASSTFTNLDCHDAIVSGMRIPIGKDPTEGIRKERVPRHSLLFNKWAEWFIHTAEIDQAYSNDPLGAPMYTHSCNRYFRPCSFLPLCAAPDIEEKELIFSEMETDRWSPLD